MRYFALRIIKWFFYVVALLELAGGGMAVVQIANVGVVSQTPGIQQPAQPGAFGVQAQQPAFQAGKPPTAAEVQAFLANNQGWAIIATILMTLIMALLTIAIAQIIGVFIDIADSTHRTAKILELRGGTA
jgi:ABC-type phosphate transport system permease subunit